MGEVFRFSKIAATGIRALRKTQAPLNLPGMLSSAVHWINQWILPSPNSLTPLGARSAGRPG
jgi:hypothetical protein